MPTNLHLMPGTVAVQLDTLSPGVTTLMMDRLLGAAESRLVDEVLEHRPELWIGAASEEGFPHLEFLATLPHARRVDVRCAILSDIAGIRHVAPSLQRLRLGRTQWPKTSLAPIGAATALDHLSLEGWAKDLDVIAGLPRLRHLSLRAARTTDAAFLRHMSALVTLEWDLGRTAALEGLEELTSLEHVALRNGSAVARLDGAFSRSLRSITLDSLTSVRALPGLANLDHLESVRVSNCRVLKDLTPLLSAPRLRYVAVSRMPHLTAEDVMFLRDHPNAPLVRLRLGTLEHTNAAIDALGAQALAEGVVADLTDLPLLPSTCWAY